MNSEQFLQEVWSEQGEGFGFVCLRSSPVSWRDIAIKVPDQLDSLELPDPATGDVYFSPNLFKRPRRRKELMLESCWLYADLDHVNPYDIDEEYEPTIAWESSPNRYQALWWIRQHTQPETHGKLNRKLTYFLGADRGGWDSTQVLRLPGTINHKYEHKPRVELLWEGAEPVRSWKRVAQYQIVQARPLSDTKPRPHGALPAGVRAKLKMKHASGDRSRVLWRLEHAMLDANYNTVEVFEALKDTVWNKWPDQPDLLRQEIERALAYRSRG